MTRDELSQHDGQDGRRAYIAVHKTVYDVTDSPLWENGHHPPDHMAGRDLTAELSQAPHIRAVVERFPVVGQLADEAQSAARHGNGKLFAIIAIIAIVVILGLVLLR